MPIRARPALRRGQGFFGGPAATANSEVEGGLREPRFFGPFVDHLRAPEGGNMPVASPIQTLLSCRRPAAVAWLVIAVVVNALDRVLWGRAWPHVGEECGKGPAPATTDLDPATPVIRAPRVFCVFASANHARPCDVLGRARPSVSEMRFSCQFVAQTPAAFRVPGAQVDQGHATQRAAIASAVPISQATAPLGKTESRPAAEPFAADVSEFVNPWHLFIVAKVTAKTECP